MIDEPSPKPVKRVFRWPWFVLAGVVLFFAVSILWLMTFVQRVKQIKASTMEMTNSSSTAAPAKQ